jgi:hypothetical protein
MKNKSRKIRSQKRYGWLVWPLMPSWMNGKGLRVDHLPGTLPEFAKLLLAKSGEQNG